MIVKFMKNLWLLAALGMASPAAAQVYGPELQGFDYPSAVHDFSFPSQAQTLTMRYLDVAPTQASNGQVAVLLHGKNFCAATWEDSITALTGAGYRVIAPDQIGFCKSSKPHAYQFTFQALARNTRALLQSLGIDRAVIVGHSTGGMLAIRYALMFPDATERLVLVDPIGLEDWKAEGVPSISVDDWYQRELKTNAAGIQRYEQATYYAGQWRPEYDRWVQMLAGLNAGPGHDAVAWDSALLYDMIYTQPVVYELGALRPDTLLMIGDKDTTAIGKDLAPPEIQKTAWRLPGLGGTGRGDHPTHHTRAFRRSGPCAADFRPGPVPRRPPRLAAALERNDRRRNR